MKILQFFLFSLILLFSGCSLTKNISNQPPYDQCIGKKFTIKEDMYIFKDNGSSLCSIAPQNSGIMGLPRYVDKKYLEDDNYGKKNRYPLVIKGIVAKGSIFTIIKVVNSIDFETSFTLLLITFDNIPSIKNGIITTEIMNWKNYPYTTTWGDPPIFEAKFAEPFPSDGVWWK